MEPNFLQLKNDFYSVGLVDKDISVFDIVMITEHGSSYNSYLLRTSEGWVLFETVKVFRDKEGHTSIKKYIKNLTAVCGDINNIKYLVLNHTEPDHSGLVDKIMELVHPNCEIIATQIAINYLKEMINHRLNYHSVKGGDVIKIGNKTLEFYSIPMMHWPDSMFTLIKEDKIAVTCDTLGTHYAYSKVLLSTMNKEEYKKYVDSYKYYFDCIFSPFKPFALNAMKAIKPLVLDNKLDLVATGHGPVLDKKKFIIDGIEKYEKWAKPSIDDKNKSVVMVLCSAYGYTKEGADIIINSLKEYKDANISVKLYMVDITNYQQQKEKMLKDILHANALLLGSPTIVNDALPPIWDLLVNLHPHEVAGKFASAFGSFGWSGEAVPNILQRLVQLKFKTMKGYRISFKLSNQEKKEMKEFAKNFADYMTKKQLAPNLKFRNPSMREAIWE